jgi:LmbE family N-acetylglucosaminyl deacetylase
MRYTEPVHIFCLLLLLYACRPEEKQATRESNGAPLAEAREKETINSLQAIGIIAPPVFLGYPDGHVHELVDSVQKALVLQLRDRNPDIVISFGPDGITGDWDHIFTGGATDEAFDHAYSCKLLLHMAVTKPLPPFYAYGVAVPRNTIDVRVKVAKYFRQRTAAVEAHKTQFSSRTRAAYKIQVHTIRKERFIIARNRDAHDLLERHF